MKYLTFSRDHLELAIVFPDLVQHREAAKALQPGDRILGAGFFSIQVVRERVLVNHHGFVIRVWGESDGLQIKSRGQRDAAAILFTLTLPSLVTA